MIGYTLKSKFWPIFGFFHGQKVVFTPTFFPKIWAFSRPLFFHGHVFGFFSRVEKFVFTGWNQKIFIFYFQFNGEKDGISSRASTSVSRVEFLEKFHGQISIFTVAFWGIFGLFHGHIFFSRPLLEKLCELVQNSTRRKVLELGQNEHRMGKKVEVQVRPLPIREIA